MSFFIGLLCFVLALVALLLICVILIQDSKSGGLSSAFGGGTDTALGTRGQKEITRFTSIVSLVFFVLCLAVGYLSKQEQAVTGINTTNELKPLDDPAGGTGTAGPDGGVNPNPPPNGGGGPGLGAPPDRNPPAGDPDGSSGNQDGGG